MMYLELTKAAVRAWGIAGDALTFSGSVVLALETLLKRRTLTRDRAVLRTVARLGRRRMEIVGQDGKPVTEQVLEEDAVVLGQKLGLAGVVILSAGFLILLAIRIWGA